MTISDAGVIGGGLTYCDTALYPILAFLKFIYLIVHYHYLWSRHCAISFFNLSDKFILLIKLFFITEFLPSLDDFDHFPSFFFIFTQWEVALDIFSRPADLMLLTLGRGRRSMPATDPALEGKAPSPWPGMGCRRKTVREMGGVASLCKTTLEIMTQASWERWSRPSVS